MPIRPENPPYISSRKRAIGEHAMMLRLEGLTLHEIGERLGVSKERARQRIIQGQRSLAWGTRHCRWQIHPHNEAGFRCIAAGDLHAD